MFNRSSDLSSNSMFWKEASTDRLNHLLALAIQRISFVPYGDTDSLENSQTNALIKEVADKGIFPSVLVTYPVVSTNDKAENASALTFTFHLIKEGSTDSQYLSLEPEDIDTLFAPLKSACSDLSSLFVFQKPLSSDISAAKPLVMEMMSLNFEEMCKLLNVDIKKAENIECFRMYFQNEKTIAQTKIFKDIISNALANTPQDDNILNLNGLNNDMRIVYNVGKKGLGTVFPHASYPASDPTSSQKANFVPAYCYFLVCKGQNDALENVAEYFRSKYRRDDYVVLYDEERDLYFLMTPIEALLEVTQTHRGLEKARVARDKAMEEKVVIKNVNDFLASEVPLIGLMFDMRAGQFKTFDAKCNPLKLFSTYLKALCAGSEWRYEQGVLFSEKENVRINIPTTPNKYYLFLKEAGIISKNLDADSLSQLQHQIRMPVETTTTASENKQVPIFNIRNRPDLGEHYANLTSILPYFQQEYANNPLLPENTHTKITISSFATMPLGTILSVLGGPAYNFPPILTEESWCLAALEDINRVISTIEDPKIAKSLLDNISPTIKSYITHKDCPENIKALALQETSAPQEISASQKTAEINTTSRPSRP